MSGSTPAATATAPDRSDADPEVFRAEVRSFFADHHPGRPPKDPRARREWQAAWLRTLVDHGMGHPAYPREWGGMELPFPLQVVYAEEAGRARVPTGVLASGYIAVPTILTAGTPEQQRRWLPALLRGQEAWCQGYSEPEAGSDLPSLRTRAIRDGDHYVVNGRKIWSSSASISDRVYALVRTGEPGSGRDGISFLVIDLSLPGVTVEPIADLSGRQHFCELTFDDVRVPVSDRVGEEDGGWALARTSLSHERAATAAVQAAFYRRVTGELVDLARDRGLLADPHVRRRLARAIVDARALEAGAGRIVADIAAHGEPGPASSVSRLQITTFEQRVHALAVEMLGLDGIVDKGEDRAVQRGRWLYGYLATRASTIGAGTAEIQRNTIAERLLDLPRDPGMPPR